MSLKIGDTLYRLGRDRTSSRNEKYEEYEIIGETRLSWITANKKFTNYRPVATDSRLAEKVKKAEIDKHAYIGGMFSELSKVEDVYWMWENAHHISRALENIRDVSIVRKIAEIIGYNEESKTEAR